jgi:integrase
MKPTATTTGEKRERPVLFTDNWLRRQRLEPNETEAIVFELGAERKGTGLGVRITKGNISFIIHLRQKNGRRWKETVGPWGRVTVKQARDRLAVVNGQITLGSDLFRERDNERAAVKAEAEAAEAAKNTVGVVVEQWKKQHLNGLRPAYAERALGNVERNFSHLFGVPAASLTTKQVKAALAKMHDKTKGRRRARGGPAATRNAAVSLKAAYAWAFDEEIIEENPLRDLKLPENGKNRERFLSEAEALMVYRAAGRLPNPAKQFVRLLMLTGARRQEIAALKWSEIADEADGKVITLAGERTKTGAGHRVPLSQAARDVIAECERNRIVGSPYVFTSDGYRHFANFGRVKGWLDVILVEDGGRPVDHFTLHDFRRTIVTYLASQGFDPVVIDRLLGHAPSKLSAVARIYQRFEHQDTRRKALETWGRFLIQPPAEVVDLKAHARR